MVLKRIGPMGTKQAAAEEKRPRILYVEDDDPTWQVTERYLRDRFSIERARNSQQALDLLRQKQFDLVLLDIELGGSELDGITLCRVLRGKHELHHGMTAAPRGLEDVPIVFVTAYSARYPKEELLAAGADDVVTKPVDYTRLLLVSSRLLVRHVVSASKA